MLVREPVRSTQRTVLALGAALALAACSPGDAPRPAATGAAAASDGGGAPRSTPGRGATPGAPTTRPDVAAATGAATAPPAAAPASGARRFSLVATGDVLLHPPLWQQAREDSRGPAGSLDFAPQLAGVRPLVAGADLAVCHLETPLAPAAGPYRGYPQFSSPPQVAAALRSTGYDVCTTASNHSVDQGAAGIDRTLAGLEAAGLAHAGTARSRAEADRTTLLTARTPAGPVRVALLSYTFGLNGIAPPNGDAWRAARIDEVAIGRDAARARRRGAEVTVVALHWGDEYDPAPNALQRRLAPRLLASPDIDLLLGHHAHVVQPLEQVGGEWVAYGLGNLVAAHRTPGQALREGLLARFAFAEQPDGRFRVTGAGVAPLLVTARPPYRVLDVAAARRGGSAVSRRRLDAAWARTVRVVRSRGARVATLSAVS